MNRRDSGSMTIEFLLVCILTSTAMAAAVPVFQVKLLEQRLARALDSYARALLIGQESSRSLMFAQAVLAASNKLLPADQAIQVQSTCVRTSTCLSAGGELRLSARLAEAHMDTIIEMPAQ